MKRIILIFLLGLLSLILLLAAAAGGAWHWANKPLSVESNKIEIVIESGGTPRSVVRQLNEAGVSLHEDAFVWLARLSGLDKRFKAGAYEVSPSDTPLRLAQRIADGDVTLRRLTLVEGWTYRQIRAALAAQSDIRQTLEGVDDAKLLERLGSEFSHPEGLFFPDTYTFAPGTSDFEILRQAYQAQLRRLDEAWQARDKELPVKTPYELLVLASIVEKETGHHEDRVAVSGVFANRLRIGMPLQTDPTVIYGMGERYQGRIRKRDLQTDTPWNTYTRNGLPPTPIASPGRAALMAAAQPGTHKYLYFVSRGDGTSEFAQNLQQHNRNVSRFILGRNP